jgi:hypothetical protein
MYHHFNGLQKVTEVVDDTTLLRAYRMEIETLKAKLKEMEETVISNSPKGKQKGFWC